MGISISSKISQVDRIKNLAYFYICILSGALPLTILGLSPMAGPIMHIETCPGFVINQVKR